eukprot:1712634-Amphidinium_carterae.1
MAYTRPPNNRISHTQHRPTNHLHKPSLQPFDLTQKPPSKNKDHQTIEKQEVTQPTPHSLTAFNNNNTAPCTCSDEPPTAARHYGSKCT